ncbi:unnamed protein product [Symbiodinium necroappetens]|uniref:Uncharacterized protein n=1 Tax=Symbiodinium necroappetens TaxID=1628268 RepID=A0A812S067_9DINO|nr:unnamed protein product [Symbiodinium necroappetens]
MLSNTSDLKMSARLAYSTGSTATQPTGHAGWGDADFSLVGNNEAELQEGMTFHFIPWFQKYTEPSGPLGLSDTVIVTSNGGQRFGALPLKMTAPGLLLWALVQEPNLSYQNWELSYCGFL